MATLLARPYATPALSDARDAIAAASRGDVRPLMRLYGVAAEALSRLDPDEVSDWRNEWRRAQHADRGAAEAALAIAETWEAVVSIGSVIDSPPRFRAFAWLAAHAGYLSEAGRPDVARAHAYSRGASIPQTSAEDAALYATLPALIGLGPELPDELPGPCPLTGDPAWRLLGLPDGDWSGVDPLDGIAIAPETCRAHFASITGPWRDLAARCCDVGMLVRTAP